MSTDREDAKSGGKSIYFALHAITEQLLSYQPDKARIGVYSYRGGAIEHRVLFQDLESPPSPFSAENVHSFAVHRNFAYVLAPPVLVSYHLRTGQLWGSVSLPSSSSPRSSLSFWVDRSGPTSLGLWSESCVYRIISPSAQEEQARLVSCPAPDLPLAEAICRQYGPSTRRLLSHRSFDDAYNQYVATLSEREPMAASSRMLALPLVLKAGLLMGTADDAVRKGLSDEIADVLHELDWLKGKVDKISSNPIIRSAKSRQRDEMTRMASSFRIK